MLAVNDSFNNSSSPSTSDETSGAQVQYILLIFVFLAVMMFICAGNLLTILAVWRTPALRTVPNMYIVSLAVADFLTGAIIPYYAVSLFPSFKEELDRDKYLCLFRYVLFHIFVAQSIVCMVAISFDRYLFIRYPLHYSTLTSPAKAGAIIAGTWLLSIVVGFVPLFYNNFSDTSGCESFKILKNAYRLYALVPGFFFCCLLTAAFYIYIVKKAFRHQKEARERRKSQACALPAANDSRREWKSVKVFLMVFGVFFACWVPNFTLITIGHIWSISPKIIQVTVILGFLNSGMNFIIYAWQNQHFRLAFKTCLRKKRRDSVGTIRSSVS